MENKPVFERIKAETSKDHTLQLVKSYAERGWPAYVEDIAKPAREFFAERGCLGRLNGIVRRGNQIAIPSSLRAEILERIHNLHMGLTKSRERYRDAVWWPHISKAVKEKVKGVLTVISIGQVSHVSRLSLHPCQNLHGRNLQLSCHPVKWSFKSFIARFGIPEQIMTDNGPQFRSQVFADFTKAYKITRITSSPYNPQANGMVKHAVKTAKTILRQENPALALLSYRDTPTEPTRESPAKLLMGRKLRTTVQMFKQNLKPRCPNIIKVKLNDARAKSANERTYNRRYSARLLPFLQKGDKVRVKTDAEKQLESLWILRVPPVPW
ncbi:hypothetical protein H4Q32_027377 [Labeo rohita]|uniref:Gypsy retrotransposon integrase-like protein 1 n=1 Tax=Labeo rohita TaxID=84645 RepID=A0ABQ8LBT3_LABRO|nr:hypothetical protein H4Q32_027377 [Labeo rohita]